MKVFVRRREARRMIGADERLFSLLVESGMIEPLHFGRGRRAYYRTAQLEALAQPGGGDGRMGDGKQ